MFFIEQIKTKIMKVNHFLQYRSKFRVTLIVMMLLLVSVSCEFTTFEDVSQTYYANSDLSISQFIESRPETYSILYDILDTTGYIHLFKTYGSYTFLAPTDAAFETFFKEKGKSSYHDYEISDLKDLIKYHVFLVPYNSGDYNMGIIDTRTFSFDYMVSGTSADGSSVMFNKVSKIVYQNNILPNGILHGVDKVIEKPAESIYDWLVENGGFSIILEALDECGLNHLVQADDNAPAKKKFYTCFFTPDDVFGVKNINSFSELAAFISPEQSNYTDSLNALNIYVRSHFVEDVISMSDATEDDEYFGTLGETTLAFGLRKNTAEVVLNSKTVDFPQGLDLDEFNSNNLVSNGIIHQMDQMYQLTTTFKRIRREFYFLDVPGIPFDSLVAAGDSLADLGLRATRLDERHRYWPAPGGADHLPFDKTAPWLTLNAPYSGKIRSDAQTNHLRLPMYLAFDICDDAADFTRKIPYVIPGKYSIYHDTEKGLERPTVKHYFNGEQIGGVINLAKGGQQVGRVFLGIVEIPEGQKENSFRVQGITPGYGLFRSVILEPVE
jgi:uncharacterized surface protein with fasciclin (FAS1) repeats